MNMTSLDFLYIVIAVSIISVVVFINILLYNVILTIQSMRHTVENLHSYTADAVNLKDKMKINALKGVKKLLSFVPGR